MISRKLLFGMLVANDSLFNLKEEALVSVGLVVLPFWSLLFLLVTMLQVYCTVLLILKIKIPMASTAAIGDNTMHIIMVHTTFE